MKRTPDFLTAWQRQEQASIASERAALEAAAAAVELVPRTTRGVMVDGTGKTVGVFPLPAGTRLEPPLAPAVPVGTTKLHERQRADGLAVDASLADYAYKSRSPGRWNPFRARWPEVAEFDARVTRLENRQADVNAELAGLSEQLRQAEASDREAMAYWVAAGEGDRPLRPRQASKPGSRT
jgi:hypothetical protein